MLPTLQVLTMTAALAAPRVDVSTLDGRAVSGEFVSLSRTELVVKTDEGETKLAVQNLLEVVYPEPEAGGGIDPEKTRIRLRDGSRVDVDSVSVNVRGATFDSPLIGEVTVPSRAVASIRFAGADEKYDATWTELATRETRSDLLVTRKADVLDHIKGILGRVDGEFVRFEVRGNEIPVALSKVYGIVYRTSTADDTSKVSCQATLRGADQLALSSIAWDRDAFIGELASGGEVVIPGDVVRSLDFSIGKIRYLSRSDPERVDYVSYWPDDFHLMWIKYRNDRNQNGNPLRIGKRTYDRGLWIHSRTTLRYRLASDFRTFKAVMGMESEAARRNRGNDVRVVIRGDDEVLLDTYVTSGDDPRELELKVDGVNFLEIEVDYGRDGKDVLDHLALGDARVLK